MVKRKSILSELIAFIRHNKAYWMIPIIAILLLLATLIALGGGSATPFIYTLF